MRRYRLSPAAERDMAEIWLYSARKWGMDRADGYIHALTEAMALTADDPLIGVSCDDIRPGYRNACRVPMSFSTSALNQLS